MVGNGRRPAVGRLARVDRNSPRPEVGCGGCGGADDVWDTMEEVPAVGSFDGDDEDDADDVTEWAAALDPAPPVRLGTCCEDNLTARSRAAWSTQKDVDAAAAGTMVNR
jgi:hypothetical protein